MTNAVNKIEIVNYQNPKREIIKRGNAVSPMGSECPTKMPRLKKWLRVYISGSC